MQAPSSADTRFRLTEEDALRLRDEFGTPLYVLSEARLRANIRRYRDSFAACAPRTQLAFASKANTTLAVVAIAHSEGLLIDVASEGELRGALATGVPASRCHFHGNNKSVVELRFAIEAGIGEIMVDNFEEISRIRSVGLKCPDLVLRLAPGVDPVTHEKISTGQEDTKFGFNITDGSAEKALMHCLDTGLPVVGFHCHVGSQLLDPGAQEAGGERLARFALEMLSRHGFRAEVLNFGGGLGIPYEAAHAPMEIERYNELLVSGVLRVLDGSGLEPVLMQEPGRALVGDAGVTLYSVGVVKTVPVVGGTRTYVSVDGGMADNPRPALYGARYPVERVSPSGHGEMRTVTVSGRHCESDTLFRDIALPADVAPGDILQVLCTGAYNSSMASNYNRYPRPATVLIRQDGSYALVQREESWDEMLSREIVPEDLRVR